MLRRALFWAHLALGVVAGFVVLVLSATGALLACQRQITAWADRDLRRIAVPEGPVSLERLLRAACWQGGRVSHDPDRLRGIPWTLLGLSPWGARGLSTSNRARAASSAKARAARGPCSERSRTGIAGSPHPGSGGRPVER